MIHPRGSGDLRFDAGEVEGSRCLQAWESEVMAGRGGVCALSGDAAGSEGHEGFRCSEREAEGGFTANTAAEGEGFRSLRRWGAFETP